MITSIVLLHHTGQSRWWYWICAVRTFVDLLTTQWKYRLERQYSPNCPGWLYISIEDSNLSINTLQNHIYWGLIQLQASIFSKLLWLRTRSAWSFRPFSLTTKCNQQEAPCRLQASTSDPLDSFIHQTQSRERGGSTVSFEHQYSQPFDSLATKHNRQKGEGPQSASSIDILWPLIASLPKIINRKGGPQISFKHRHSLTFDSLATKDNWQKGRAPDQLRASTFSDLW